MYSAYNYAPAYGYGSAPPYNHASETGYTTGYTTTGEVLDGWHHTLQPRAYERYDHQEPYFNQYSHHNPQYSSYGYGEPAGIHMSPDLHYIPEMSPFYRDSETEESISNSSVDGGDHDSDHGAVMPHPYQSVYKRNVDGKEASGAIVHPYITPTDTPGHRSPEVPDLRPQSKLTVAELYTIDTSNLAQEADNVIAKHYAKSRDLQLNASKVAEEVSRNTKTEGDFARVLDISTKVLTAWKTKVDGMPRVLGQVFWVRRLYHVVCHSIM